MGFWDNFNASKHAFYQFTSSIRGKRLSLGNIESAITDLYKWQREFESLEDEAAAERNAFAAKGALNKILDEIIHGKDSRINKLLDLRNKLQRIHQETLQKISRLEDSIRRLEESIRYDYQKSGSAMRRSGNSWKGIDERIKEKESKLASMKESLSQLNRKAADLYSGTGS